MIKSEYKYSDITEKIIGCSMRVHNKLGNGFQEVIYQRALAIELNKINLEFEREVEIPIFMMISTLVHGEWILWLKKKFPSN